VLNLCFRTSLRVASAQRAPFSRRQSRERADSRGCPRCWRMPGTWLRSVAAGKETVTLRDDTSRHGLVRADS